MSAAPPSRSPSVSPEKEAEKIRIPEFDLALKNRSVTFGNLLDAMRGMEDEDDKVDRLTYERYYPTILEAFVRKWGPIHFIFASETCPNAMVFTERGHIFHYEAVLDQQTLEFLHQCDALTINAHRLLRLPELFSFMNLVAELMSHLFASCERLLSEAIPLEEYNKMVKYLKGELKGIEEKLESFAERRARLEYYGGMWRGIIYVGFMSIVIGLVMYYFKAPDQIIVVILGCIMSGGVGAIISVMARMSSGNFPLEHEAGPSHNSRIGVFRPLIGATMGAMLYLLIMSGLVPFEMPEDGLIQLYYFLGIAFSAGFTERWAQGMLPGAKKG